MRIAIDDVVIAGQDPFKESVRNLSISGGPVIQKIMPLRAAEPTWIDRGNESYSLSFEICRLHNSIPEAGIFCLEHFGSFQKVGTVDISVEYDGKRIERKANGCVRQLGGCRWMGLSTFIRYEVEIGQVKDPNER